jgi:hypothetical protein
MKDDTERKLLAYLHEQRTADVAGTLKTIANWTTTHESKDDLRHEELRGEMRGHSLRIGSLEKADDEQDDKLNQSGAWQVEAEQAKAIVAAKEATWWKDKAITIIVGLVMLILGGAGALLFRR